MKRNGLLLALTMLALAGCGSSSSSSSTATAAGPLPSRAVACARFQTYVANYPYSNVGAANASSPAQAAGARSAYYTLFHTLQRSCPSEARKNGEDGDAGTRQCKSPQENIAVCQAFNDPNFPASSTRNLVSLYTAR